MSRIDSQRSVFKKLTALAIGLQMTLTSKSACAVVSTGAAAAVTSSALGFDPIAWGIGGLGGTFIYLRGEPSPRKEVAANLILSILLGGVASPLAYAILVKIYPHLGGIPGQYLVALILCFGWPQLSKLVYALLSKRYGRGE